MRPVDIYIRFSEHNRHEKLLKAATLQMEGNLVYRDEGGLTRAHFITALKFGSLTLFSPLICLARLVRSVAFMATGDASRSAREFIGAISTPIIAGGCFVGTLASSALSLLSFGTISFHYTMRKTYAHFEAWVNGFSLHSRELPSYSQRVSTPFDCIGSSKGKISNVWTTAPCMQPILEQGKSSHGGLLDVERMRKIFPFVHIKGMQNEHGKIVIQSEYLKENVYEKSCGGLCEHARVSTSCCCCFQIQAVYDRVLCCEVGQGNCSTICSPSDSTSICFCTVCGVGCCCLTEKVDNVSLGVQQVGCLSC